ncbi:GAF domain-containing protein [Methylacidimicrobium sp. B4]|uniref:GAF domain-containing protein n=1 Tax=Methylacidimicrobium sp. B4 TaxID=2796139 RepID=UPI001A8EFBDE|nr:GAF domain-containing protein [Methylacidimicrobium sp. B4]QSR85118.1 GAF domain-containing protein [Methylacidimicrobium sp. B4]
MREARSIIERARPEEIQTLLNPRGVIRHFLRLALTRTEADSGSFVLLNPSTGFLDIEASVGLRKGAVRTKLRADEGVTGWVATTGRPMRISDVRREWRYVPIDPRIRAELAVPVEVGSTVIGVLNVDSHRVGHFTRTHEQALSQLAAQAAQWLAIGWEIEGFRQKARQLGTLVEIAQTLVSQPDLNPLFDGVVRNAARLMGGARSFLFLLTEDKTHLLLRAAFSDDPGLPREFAIPVDESVFSVVVKKGKPLLVLDLAEEPYVHCPELQIGGQELRSVLAVPLSFVERVGVLCVCMAQRHRFANSEIELLQTLADLSTVAIQKARLLQQVMKIEEGLRQSERLSALGLLATEVAHEIRNPLTVIQMLFYTLADRFPDDPGVQKDVAVIAAKLCQMNRITEQVLTLGRSAQPLVEPISVERMLDEILLLVRHKLSAQGIQVEKEIPAEIPPLQGDRGQIEQALLNLILNAAEAMPRGGVLGLNTSVVERDGIAYLALGVRDSGPGMTQEEVENLFVPFLTRKAQGTGIGMAIVRKIMEDHRGKVEVDSAPGKGSHLSLLFPLAPP